MSLLFQRCLASIAHYGKCDNEYFTNKRFMVAVTEVTVGCKCAENVSVFLPLDLMKCPAVILSLWMCRCVQVLQAVRPS